MKIIDNKYRSLVVCVISSIFIVMKMYLNNNIYLVLFIILTFFGMAFENEDRRVDYLMYFLSWIYAIKFQFSQFSMFILLIVIYILLTLIDFMIKKKKISFKMLLYIMFFIIYLLLVSVLSGGNIVDVVGFVLNFVVIFFAVTSFKGINNFKRYTYMYSIGLFLSSCIRLLSYSVPNLDNFINSMTRVNTVYASGRLSTRFAGLDLDPNYFSVKILFALACLFVIMYHEKKMKQKDIFLFVSLLSFGLMSLSKMFVVTVSMLLVFSVGVLLRTNLTRFFKVILIIIIVSIVFNSTIINLYDAYFIRFFGGSADLNEITTGRSESWLLFIQEIFSNLKVLLIGAGYGTPPLGGTIAHNMYLSSFYYLGIVGIIVTFFYLLMLYMEAKRNLACTVSNTNQITWVNKLPFFAILIPNLSLDSFVMDFFPYQLLLLFLSLSYQPRYSYQKSR